MPKYVKDVKDTKYGDLTGKTFGRLHVDSYAGTRRYPSGATTHMWNCTCECGNKVVRDTNGLVNGKSIKNCGCYTNEIRRANAMREKNNPNTINNRGLRQLYNTYNNMKERCLNIGGRDYMKGYGCRGITICDEWLGPDGWETFVKWSLDNGWVKNQGLSIDRIDVNGNYCPENCRWTTTKVQNRNTRANLIIYDGEEELVRGEFVEKYKLHGGRFIDARLEFGWTMNAIVHAAKHPELGMRRIGNDMYRDKDGFLVLVPNYIKMAPGGTREKLIEHEKMRQDLLARLGKTKRVEELNLIERLYGKDD